MEGIYQGALVFGPDRLKMNDELPQLPHLTVDQNSAHPSQKIRFEEDVVNWKTTKGYQNYLLFLRRLSNSVINYELPASMSGEYSSSVEAMIDLLDELNSWIDDIPPLPTPQRFGNLAFRAWGERLEQRADELLLKLLPDSLHSAAPFLSPYLIISFGSFIRMDYGTGHEAAFALLILCLTLIRFYQTEADEERSLVLHVFLRYMRLCWRLQDVYKLEPAGSHGVWGLDDSSFLGYIFGSAQLLDQKTIPVSSILRTPLPPTNFYNIMITRIHEVKHGPFHEHSSQLHSIAVGVQTWKKVHSGLFKMYEAEVLGKRVVVQHLPLGGLVEWNSDSNTGNTNILANEPQSRTTPASKLTGYSDITSVPATDYDAKTRAPWASGSAPPTPPVTIATAMPPPTALPSRWTASTVSTRPLNSDLMSQISSSSLLSTQSPGTNPHLKARATGADTSGTVDFRSDEDFSQSPNSMDYGLR